MEEIISQKIIEETPKKKKKKDKSAEKVEQTEKADIVKTIKYKTKKFKVLIHKDNKVIIDFNGKCVSLQGNIKVNKGMVEVEYLGKIGTKDFSVKLK